MLENLWDEAEAAKHPGYAELVYRANLLGQDPSVTNWKGGNISGKYMEKDFDGRTVQVLRIKGSGSDLRTAVREDFAGVRHEPVLRLYDRKEMSDEEMVAYLAHCLTDIPSKRPSIETLMHSFLPFEHIDHTHADYALWFAAAEEGRKLAEDLLQEELVWVDYHRPGFTLAKRVSEAVKKNPKGKCVILAKHGLLTWGRTSKESYHNTLAMLKKFDAAVKRRISTTRVFGGARVETLPEPTRREILFEVLPALRGAMSGLRPAVLRVDESPEVLEFVNGATSRDLAAIGAACPDHMVSTKVVPYFATWDPKSGTAGALREELVPAMEKYRRDYEAYFQRWNRDPKMKMDDPYPRVVLIPGVGMVAAGKTRETALASTWLYQRAITVMKGASAQGTFASLTEEEAFNIEYWPLERYKLTTLPPDKELTGQVAFVAGPGSLIARRLSADGAHVVLEEALDPANEAAVVGAFRKTVLEYGGLDVLVASADVGSGRPVEEQSLEEWKKIQTIVSTGLFLLAREALRILTQQGRGGRIVFVLSSDALAPGKNVTAQASARAAALHLARCLAEEGAPKGIRVNVVNPGGDAEKVAEAVHFFVSSRSSKSTGNVLNVDGGVRAAYPR